MNDTLLTAIITATVAVLIATGSGGFAFWRYLQGQERERQAKIVAEELSRNQYKLETDAILWARTKETIEDLRGIVQIQGQKIDELETRIDEMMEENLLLKADNRRLSKLLDELKNGG